MRLLQHRVYAWLALLCLAAPIWLSITHHHAVGDVGLLAAVAAAHDGHSSDPPAPPHDEGNCDICTVIATLAMTLVPPTHVVPPPAILAANPTAENLDVLVDQTAGSNWARGPPGRA
jgi:hypothetical protein